MTIHCHSERKKKKKNIGVDHLGLGLGTWDLGGGGLELQISKCYSRQCLRHCDPGHPKRDALFMAFDAKERVVAFHLNKEPRAYLHF